MKKQNISALLLLALLVASCERADLTSPVALFDLQTQPRYLFKVNLDASGSFADRDGGNLQYRWDLNGDHLLWETDWLSTPVLTVQFPFRSNGYIGLQVRDSDGNTTELYQGIYTDENYRINNAWSDLDIDFRRIDYSIYGPDYHHFWIWAYDNIQLMDSEEWYNFPFSSDRARYGTLMPWNKAKNLDEDYILPSRAQWQQMIGFCGGEALAGFNLQVEAEHGLQLTCPGLVRDDRLEESGVNGYYWTGDEADKDSAWALKISATSDEAEFVILDKTSMASVRLMMEYYQYFR